MTRQLVVLALAGVIGYAMGLTPLLVSTATRATHGGPDVLVLIGSIFALLTFAPLGYVVGASVPSSFAVVAAITTGFVFVLAGGSVGPQARTWSPVWLTGLASAGQQENSVVSAFRILFFAVLAACLVLVATRWVERRSPTTALTSMTSLTWVIVPIGLAALAMGRPVDAVVREEEPPRACDAVAGVDVCVHKANEAALEPVVHAVEDTLVTAGLTDSTFVQEVLDSALWIENPPSQVALYFQFQRGEAWVSDAALQVARELSGTRACHLLRRHVVTETMPVEYLVADAVAQWIWIKAGFGGVERSTMTIHPAATALLHNMLDRPDGEVREWIVAHQDDLSACAADKTGLG